MTTTFDPSAAARPDSGLFGLDSSPEQAAVHILGVPFDATTSFHRGAAGGPAAILAASHQVDLFDALTGRPYEAGIHMPAVDPGILELNARAAESARPLIEGALDPTSADAAKRIAQVDAAQEQLNAWVDGYVRAALDAGKLVGLVGGDHSIPFASICAHTERFPGLGILHFDAHADLRVAYEGFHWSHASILHNVLAHSDGTGDGRNLEQVLQVGIRDLSEEEFDRIRASGGRLRAVFDHEWGRARLSGKDLALHIRRALEGFPKDVYITFDIDGLDPALCPHTGTPVPGGLRWDETMLWLGELVRAGHRIVGFDLCEVAPAPGGTPGEGWDENVGARLLYRLIGFALQSRA